jgi:hypothetical protein
VHLVRYAEALSLRTNGKSDGSINLDRAADPATDEITMVLTGGVPMALRPDAKTVAVIGIGTGLTTHTLLQGLEIERVDTIEIEAAMVEASRGFLPRNRGAYADPRGTIVIDDAKTFFAARGSRYDLIISEPSNPWVSGVSSLFTREFYRRVRDNLAEGGVLVQWFQLYEIDASLVASVMAALGAEFPHYAIYAASDHDLLIVASRTPVPRADAKVFEQPGLASELRKVHVLTVGDLDARYLGSRAIRYFRTRSVAADGHSGRDYVHLRAEVHGRGPDCGQRQRLSSHHIVTALQSSGASGCPLHIIEE